MSKFAVVKTGGKQYLVREREKLRVEKFPLDNSALIAFNEVLAVGDENGIEAGGPILSNFKVEAERIGEGRFKKVIVARYYSKTRYRKTKGHRQHFTEVKIKVIVK